MARPDPQPQRPRSSGIRATWASTQLVRAAADFTSILAAFLGSYALYAWAGRTLLHRGPHPAEPYLPIALLFGALALCAFVALGLYRDRASVLNLWEYETAVKGIGIAAACFFAVLFFLKLTGYSRLVVVGAIALATLLVLLSRRLLSAVIWKRQLAGRLGRRALICGCGETGRLVMKKIVQAPHLGCAVVGFLDDEADEGASVECRIAQDGAVLRVPVLGRTAELCAMVARWDVDELFVTAGTGSPERMQEVLELAAKCGVRVAVVPRLGDLGVHQMRVEDLSAVPLLRPGSARAGRLHSVLKRAFDVGAAIAIGLLTLPLWIGITLLLRVAGEGSVLFAHERVGLGGRRFRMFKFRTMRRDADPYARSPGSGDPGVTRIGRLLRVPGLDELPQLINVLRGEMSLVGPRPEMPFIVDRYGPLERERLRVKPGITGLWQVSADREADIHENLEYDLYYVGHQSLLLDVLILMETAFFAAGAVLRALGERRAERDVRRGSSDAAPEPGHAHTHNGDPGYVLMALDQRRNGAVPVTWERSLPVAAALARRWPVKVLAAAPNRAAFDRLFADWDRGEEWEDRHAAYVSYRARAELRELAVGARLVVTDLPHVAAWVTRAGGALIWAAPEGLQWVQMNGQGPEITAELARWVAPAVAEAAAS